MRSWPAIVSGKKIRPSHITGLQDAIDEIDLAIIGIPAGDFELVDDTTPQLGGDLDLNGFNVGGASATELGYLSGVMSSVQDQIDAIDSGVWPITRQAKTFYLSDYEVALDGTTDDRAGVQQMFDDIWEEGGNCRVVFEGNPLIGLRTPLEASNTKIGIHVWMVPNLEIVGHDAVIKQTEGYVNPAFRTFNLTAPAVATPATIGSLTSAGYHSHQWVDWLDSGAAARFPIYAVDASSTVRGSDEIELNTAADIDNFAVGDPFAIRTGQTITGYANPDAEINFVRAIDDVNGIIYTEYPLSKTYVQEYWADAGETGATSTSSTSYPAPFGVQNISGEVVRNIGFRKLGFDLQPDTGGGYAIHGWGAVGLRIEECYGTFVDMGFDAAELWRDKVVRNNRGYFHSTGAGISLTTADKACGDYVVEGNRWHCTGPGGSFMHNNEGVYNSEYRFNEVVVGSCTSSNDLFGASSRLYDLRFLFNQLTYITSGGGRTIYLPEHIDGALLAGNRVSPESAYVQIQGGTRVAEFGNDWPLLYDFTMDEGVSVATAAKRPAAHTPVTVVGIVTDTITNRILGTLPAHAIVTTVNVSVMEAFNGTSPTVSVGIDVYNPFICGPIDVSTTGNKEVTLTSSHIESNQQIEIYCTSGGSSAGKCIVALTYVLGPNADVVT